MSRLDSFFNKGFKAATCKTLLKLTIPRIKLLRNRREIQLKQMRRDIAKLLETGQEATARIRVEHIVREEKMMAAQEIIELFSELITVRLPIIESQREYPLDLKEAISSICFAAPRCTDLPELIQVQMLFVGKYGKEFVQAAMELMPECGVNRQLIELLSVRAPAPDVKLKLLKDIAEEHELDWDPAASESELLKPHEDLLNGPAQFVSGTELPLPEEKIDDAVLYSASAQVPLDQTNSDEKSDFPEVPKASQHSSTGTGMAPEMLHFPAAALSGLDPDSPYSGDDETHSHKLNSEPNELPQEILESKEPSNTLVRLSEDKQFLPFISPPPLSSSSSETQQNPLPSVSRTNSEVNVERQPNPLPSVPRTTSEDNVEKQIKPLPSVLRTNTEVDVDLQDVLSAAQAAASSAEHAAAAARTAATLAQVRIDELVKKRNVENSDTRDNPFHAAISQSDTVDRPPTLNHVSSFTDSVVSSSPHLDLDLGHRPTLNTERLPQSDNLESNSDPHISGNLGPDQDRLEQQPQRSNSIDDDSYLPIPNLFTHGSKSVSGTPLFDDKFDSAGKH